MADPTTRVPSTSTTANTSVSRSTSSSAGVATATTAQVDIASVMERYGWQPGEWQERLLQSADGAGSENGAASAAADEEVVDAEVVDEQK